MKWEKTVHPASRKPEKAAWAKKGIPVAWKPERAVKEKIRDWSVTLCLIGSSCNQISVSTIKFGQHQSIWSTFNQVAKWWYAQRYKGNSRVGTQWDCSHRCFSSFYTNCIISIFRRRSLTRTSAYCTKRLLHANLKINTIHFTIKFQNCFSFSVLFYKNVQCSVFDICIWH